MANVPSADVSLPLSTMDIGLLSACKLHPPVRFPLGIPHGQGGAPNTHAVGEAAQAEGLPEVSQNTDRIDQPRVKVHLEAPTSVPLSVWCQAGRTHCCSTALYRG